MGTNLEIELKAKIDKNEYDFLIQKYDGSGIYSQINFYLDDSDLTIRQNKCGLRIRKINNDFELTLKVPEGDGKLEINQQINKEIFNFCRENGVFPNGEVKDYLNQKMHIDTSKISILGKLETDRLDIEFKSSLISIDKSHYNGITDYEIECESNSLTNAKQHLIEFLKENGIEYRKQSDSKLKRFLNTLNLSC